MLREQTDCGDSRISQDHGLVAYLDGEPAGWCDVEPRTAFPYLRSVPWRNRTRTNRRRHLGGPMLSGPLGSRRRGLSYALARAAVDFARERRARALEGYPMIPAWKKGVMGRLGVGHVSIFAAAGFAEASRPTLAAPSCASTSSRARVTFPNAGAVECTRTDQGLSDDEHGHERGFERRERVTNERNPVQHCVVDALCCRAR